MIIKLTRDVDAETLEKVRILPNPNKKTRQKISQSQNMEISNLEASTIVCIEILLQNVFKPFSSSITYVVNSSRTYV